MRRRLPIIRQAETSECGIACLSMIAGFYGHKLDMMSMRRKFTASSRGLTLQSIMIAAQSLSLATRAVRIEIDDLNELRLPCILHWKHTHFVVLKRCKSGGVIIHDPSTGVRRVGAKEISNCFTGIALEIWPTAEFSQQDESDPVTIGELLGSVVGLRPDLLRTFALAGLIEAITLVSPLLFQWVVDHVILKRQGQLAAAVMGLLFFGLFEVWATAARDLSALNLSNRVSISWQSSLLSHLVRLPIAFFERRSSGDILSRFDASEVVRGTLTGSFTSVVMSGLVAILTLAAMLFYSRPLGVVVCLGAAIFLGIRHFTLYRLRELAMDEASNNAQVRSHLMETLHGIRPLKLFGQEAVRSSRWLNYLVDATNARSKAEMFKVWINASSSSVLRTETAALVAIGAMSVMHGNISIGALFAFLAYKDHFNANVLALINNGYDISALSVHLDRMSDIVRQIPEPQTEGSALQSEQPTLPGAASVELSSVWFRYSDSDPWLIKDFSLTIPAGECLALTGRSGAGKSTLVKLICGLLSPTAGSIMINGRPVTGVNRVGRNWLGMVLQEDCLFSGTIAENIHFFSDEPDMDRVQECARLAALEVEIAQMPMRYATHIGMSGTGISGGQRQRVLIARALYNSPVMLIFDESTSHLDLITEKIIAASLSRLPMTRIIVAHRPETVLIADRVVDLDSASFLGANTFGSYTRMPGEEQTLGYFNEKGEQSHVGAGTQQSICTIGS